MKMSAQEDIEAPIAFVYEQITDFPGFERQALRRGAEVVSVESPTALAPGLAWDVSFKLRGKQRKIQIEVKQLDPPNGLVIASRAPTIGGDMVVDLVALSRSRTRMSIAIAMEPKTLSGRLMVQSMKLARKTLTRRLRKRVSEYALDMEERHKRIA
ncbi:MAG: SRPBCC family protein [Pseudomonadota bacterium]|uniref:SRPBCC family protein n=1 Tax=Roseovarius sp. TaxID=1486281 RepID=UPI003569B50D